MVKRMLLRSITLLLNVAVVYFITLILALIVTGGYQFELFGITLSSNRIDPLAIGLMTAGGLRLALHLGPGNSALVFAGARTG